MTIPKIDLRPDGEGKGTVFINDCQVGTMWMTDRGCCYQHTDRGLILSTDDVAFIVGIMRGIECLGLTTPKDI